MEAQTASDRARRRGRLAVWIAAMAVVAAAAIQGLSYWVRHQPLKELTGVVLRQDQDPAKQPPVAGAEVSLADDLSPASAWSDSAGLFHLKLRPGTRAGQEGTLTLRHADYQPAQIAEVLQDRLYVIRLAPNVPASSAQPQLVTDIKVRYSLKSATAQDVGSAMKSFEVVNQGDVPCERRFPCSPDGKWKAAIGGVKLDAVEGSEFHNARVTCVAGPCPFTRIEMDGFSTGGRSISVRVRNWSDTASFVLEADVIRPVNTDNIRTAFPITLNQVLSFTLPALAQGPIIEAAINGEDIIYPLGPALKLSWADCGVTTMKDQTRLFRCELKPGYRFP